MEDMATWMMFGGVYGHRKVILNHLDVRTLLELMILAFWNHSDGMYSFA